MREDDLPELRIVDWRDVLPLKQGMFGDGDLRPGYQVFGNPPVAAIWYREEDDTVVLHHNDRLRGAMMARVNGAVTALRLAIARG